MPKAEDKTEVGATLVLTLDQRVKGLVKAISNSYISDKGMQEIRRDINYLVREHARSLTAEEAKEFSRLLREAFDRFKMFAEASYSEILVATQGL